jgi:hypothetical protein
MGYPDHVGFRAGTCTSFYFYNLNFELKTPLKIIPFAFMDVTLKNYMKLTNEKAYEKDCQNSFYSFIFMHFLEHLRSKNW